MSTNNSKRMSTNKPPAVDKQASGRSSGAKSAPVWVGLGALLAFIVLPLHKHASVTTVITGK